MRHLAHLKAAGVVRFVGSSRNGHWEVVRKENTSVADLSAGGINGGSRGGINGGINEALLSTINKEPGHGVAFYLKAFPVGRRTLERAMATLIAAGKIEHRGSKKTGGYFALVKN